MKKLLLLVILLVSVNVFGQGYFPINDDVFREGMKINPPRTFGEDTILGLAVIADSSAGIMIRTLSDTTMMYQKEDTARLFTTADAWKFTPELPCCIPDTIQPQYIVLPSCTTVSGRRNEVLLVDSNNAMTSTACQSIQFLNVDTLYFGNSNSMAYLPNVDTALYGGTEIWLFKNNNGDTMATGFGKFYNPKYDQSTPGFGIWDTSGTYSTGDTVIWGGKHWVSVAGGDGSAVDIFNLDSDWDVVPFNEASYNVVFDPIEYDIVNDFIVSRKEVEGNNYVSCSYAVGSQLQSDWSFLANNPIKVFQWGNSYQNFKGIGSNFCNNSYVECINYRGIHFVYNTANNLSFISQIYADESSSIYELSVSNNSYILNISVTDNSTFFSATANYNSSISDISINNNISVASIYAKSGGISNFTTSFNVANLNVNDFSYDFLNQIENNYGLSGITATAQALQFSFKITFDNTAGWGQIGALTLPVYTVPQGYTLKNVAYNTAGLTTAGAGSIINLGLTGAATSIFNDTTGDIDGEINTDLINVSSVIPSPAFLTTTAVGLVGEVKVNDITAGSLTVQLTYIKL